MTAVVPEAVSHLKQVQLVGNILDPGSARGRTRICLDGPALHALPPPHISDHDHCCTAQLTGNVGDWLFTFNLLGRHVD